MRRILLTVTLCIFAFIVTTPTVVVADTGIGELKGFGMKEDPLQEAFNENKTRIVLEQHEVEGELISELEDARVKVALEERIEQRSQVQEQKEIERKQKERKTQEKVRKTEKNVKDATGKNFDKNSIPESTKSFNLSFYSTLPEENGGYSNMANGQSIHSAQMVVASNYYPMGTKIYLEGWGIMTVSDRGGSAFNNPSRLDVLIHQKSGESKSAYKQRISDLGRRTVSGYIVN